MIRFDLTRAFTLLETLVYIGLLSMLMTGVISCFYAIQESSAIVVIDAELHDEGTWMLDTIKSAWESAGYAGTVSFPRTASYIQVTQANAYTDAANTTHGLKIVVQFTLSAIASTGVRRSRTFSESLYPVP